MSGGEKKKVEIASVLIFEPEVLMLDEPTANVDGKARRFILETLKSYEGTLVIATHEVEIARTLADRIVILNLDHRIEVEGGKEVLRKDVLEKVGVI